MLKNNQVKERGIPYSGPMVVSVLKDWKWQTRRTKDLDILNEHPDEWEFNRIQEGYKDGIPRFVFIGNDGEPVGIKCPYGVIGERLYVREAWRLCTRWDENSGSYIGETFPDAANFPIRYEADGLECRVKTDDIKWGRYRHARFMPRWASRLTLEITDIKVERLRAISEEDAKAEGVERGVADEKNFGSFCAGIFVYRNYSSPVFDIAFDNARYSFLSLWDSINGAGSSEDDPWCWVISFKVLQPEDVL